MIAEEFPELSIIGGGRKADLTPFRIERRIPGSGSGVRSPDLSVNGKLTPERAELLATRMKEVVQSTLGTNSSVGRVRLYGVLSTDKTKAINIGPVKANGTPTKKEMKQIKSYRAKTISIIHVSYGRVS